MHLTPLQEPFSAMLESPNNYSWPIATDFFQPVVFLFVALSSPAPSPPSCWLSAPQLFSPAFQVGGGPVLTSPREAEPGPRVAARAARANRAEAERDHSPAGPARLRKHSPGTSCPFLSHPAPARKRWHVLEHHRQEKSGTGGCRQEGRPAQPPKQGVVSKLCASDNNPTQIAR